MPDADEVTGLEIIPLTECVRLVESKEIARVAFSAAGSVQLFPINYVWDGEGIAFRCEPESPIADVVGLEVVIEIDGSDARKRSGWSVIARGYPVQVKPGETPELAKRLKRLALFPWSAGDKEVWLRLIPAPLTGRRVQYVAP